MFSCGLCRNVLSLCSFYFVLNLNAGAGISVGWSGRDGEGIHGEGTCEEEEN